MFLTVKALHIVSLVAWFAGLFYIVRLFVYLRETQDRPQPERDILEPQLRQMARRLWFGITWPAGVATLFFGTWLLQWFWPLPGWLQVKLGLVGLLVAYHLACHRMHGRLQAGAPVASSLFFRVWNEVATLLLVSIVFAVVLKSSLGMVYAVAGAVALSAALTAGIVVYQRLR